MLGVCALSLVAFTSCKEDATAKIKSENVAEAAERDASSGNFATISFEEAEHDFGTIKNGTPVETIFKYKNTGSSPLVVSNIQETVRIKATIEGDPNAQQQQPMVQQPAAGAQSIMQQPARKYSTQPGHEGHNHD